MRLDGDAAVGTAQLSKELSSSLDALWMYVEDQVDLCYFILADICCCCYFPYLRSVCALF